MFIKKLYRYNKPACGVFVFFILSYLIINYKWGTVATPVLQYGMYSSRFTMKDTQAVYEVEANRKRINCADLSLTNRDILQIFPEMYDLQKRANPLVFVTMERYFKYAGLKSLMSEEKYSNHINDTVFLKWYKTRLEDMTGHPVNELCIYKQHFTWQNNRLQPADTATKLYCLGTE